MHLSQRTLAAVLSIPLASTGLAAQEDGPRAGFPQVDGTLALVPYSDEGNLWVYHAYGISQELGDFRALGFYGANFGQSLSFQGFHQTTNYGELPLLDSTHVLGFAGVLPDLATDSFLSLLGGIQDWDSLANAASGGQTLSVAPDPNTLEVLELFESGGPLVGDNLGIYIADPGNAPLIPSGESLFLG
ncbi:MAG: hypothetical protein VX684_07345, partial [Planctomycetota bacterium]|nr:hypothetical protein [Planctomycetota bacterium]